MDVNKRNVIFLIITCSVLFFVCCNENNDEKTNDAGINNSDSGSDTDMDSGTDGDASVDDGGSDGSICKWRKMYEYSSFAIYDIWGSSLNNIIAVGGYSSEEPWDDTYFPVMLHYDGEKWTEKRNIPGYVLLQSIWGIDEKNVYVRASNDSGQILLRYNGNTWFDFVINQMFTNAIWGSSGTDVYAAGFDYNADDLSRTGNIFHYDGVEWSCIYDGGIIPEGVWGSSGNDVYVAAYHSIVAEEDPPRGSILHYDGNEWTEIETSDYRLTRDVWGSSASDILIIDNDFSSPVDFINSTIRHYDGNEWSVMVKDIPEQLERITGSSGDNVYASGKVTYHYDGDSWSKVELDEPWEMQRIWTYSEKEAFAVGQNMNSKKGVILHYSCE